MPIFRLSASIFVTLDATDNLWLAIQKSEIINEHKVH